MKCCFRSFDSKDLNTMIRNYLSERISEAICLIHSHFVTAVKRLTVLCETKWDETKWKWKSVVCEMGICSLRNGNLYFAKWKSVVCEMKICSLRNENL